RDYLVERSRGESSRMNATTAIEKIGERFPEAREACIAVLTRQLERAEEEVPALNGFIISHLVDLKAVEALPAIREAYRAGAVDFTILGDFQDAEIELGVREKRSSPPQYPSLAEAYGLVAPREAAVPAPDWPRVG